MTEFIMRKKWQKQSSNYIQTTCISSYHEENTCKVSNRSVQNYKRSCAHKTPQVNGDGWTNGRTDERTNVRKLIRLSRPCWCKCDNKWRYAGRPKSKQDYMIKWKTETGKNAKRKVGRCNKEIWNYNIQSNLVISNSFISNYRLSRSENLVPVLTWNYDNR